MNEAQRMKAFFACERARGGSATSARSACSELLTAISHARADIARLEAFVRRAMVCREQALQHAAMRDDASNRSNVVNDVVNDVVNEGGTDGSLAAT